MLNGISAQPDMQMRQLANEFVNATFWVPMLREFRESQRSSLFGDGPGATTFVQQLDRELITRMSQKGSSPLAESLLRQLGGEGVRAAQYTANPSSNESSTGESVNQGNDNE